jgi:hypothetical protein
LGIEEDRVGEVSCGKRQNSWNEVSKSFGLGKVEIRKKGISPRGEFGNINN